ncbi:MAG: hypothetical protein MRERC_2c088 [Mycoplasmataceae bacterium RC_NB112A]|nr:MAG: hypothetical protein MRERC_2c088 [Mycoplasmataceae bacterium RC_NB112A]
MYWQDICGEDGVRDILASKKWLEPIPFKKVKQKPKKPPLPANSVPPIRRDFFQIKPNSKKSN